ncbi:MAG TPA: hypothetical protein VGP72_13600 [Planctomycetota bacterium]
MRKAAADVIKSAEESQSLFGAKATAISNLRKMANECSEEGWDGDDASPVDPDAVDVAETFIRSLPDWVPLPKCAPEPDGAISLDWIESRLRLFTLSIGSSNLIPYALLDGADKDHGVAQFDGQTIPSRVLFLIESITGCANADIRVA